MKNDYAPAPIVMMDGQGRVVSVVKAEAFKAERKNPGFKPPRVLTLTPEQRTERARKASAARWGRERKVAHG